MDKPLKIGWIGTGVMGGHMCKHLLNKGYDLSIFTRTQSKAQSLMDLGAKWGEPIELAKQSDILFLMLGYPKDVEEVCLGSKGIISHMRPG